MKNYELGENIYSLRNKQSLTQDEFAKKVGVTGKAVSKWETGASTPSIEVLTKIASEFDISLDELLKVRFKGHEKKIAKIVLTGGPCAGKTTAMNWIQNFFQKKGYAVIFIPETATELITSGISPTKVEDFLTFQTNILELQLAKEKVYRDGAINLPEDKILIVCDRGILDNKAYLSKREWQRLLKSSGYNEVELQGRYDAIFHLVTAAKGAKDFYNLDNPARRETPEEAISVDDAIVSAWTGHPYLRLIDNSTSFEEKMKRLLTEISHFLGEPEPYEIERKYLIDYPDIEYLEKLPNCKKINIIQTYLQSDKSEEVRIRQRGYNGNYTYSKTRKVEISGIKRIELEQRLSESEYVELLTKADPEKGQIIKSRYCLVYNNEYFEIDIYPFWSDKAILEIEINDENKEIKIPPFINVQKEVTDDLAYRNSSLAKKRVKN